MLSRRAILITASAFALTPAFAAAPQAFDAVAFAEAQRTGRPILVAIHASWCPTCKAQKPILGDLLGDPKYRNLVYFVVDFDSQKDLLKRFDVRTQSTLIAFKGSQEEARSVGDTNRESIATLLNKAL
jgi:thioredoxin 1